MKMQHFLVTVELDDAATLSQPLGYVAGEVAQFTQALFQFHTPQQERLFAPRVLCLALDDYQAAILEPQLANHGR